MYNLQMKSARIDTKVSDIDHCLAVLDYVAAVAQTYFV